MKYTHHQKNIVFFRSESNICHDKFELECWRPHGRNYHQWCLLLGNATIKLRWKMRCWNRTDQESGYMRYTDWGYTKIWRYKTSKTGCLQRGNSEYVVQWFGTASVTNWAADGCWPENLVSVEFLAIQGVRSSYSCNWVPYLRANWYTTIQKLHRSSCNFRKMVQNEPFAQTWPVITKRKQVAAWWSY